MYSKTQFVIGRYMFNKFVRRKTSSLLQRNKNIQSREITDKIFIIKNTDDECQTFETKGLMLLDKI